MEKMISIIYDGVITNINILFLLYFQQRSYETIPKVHSNKKTVFYYNLYFISF